jgi:RNA polymerase sigma factor (sigma-70 family)
MRVSTRNPVRRIREYLLVRDLAAFTDAALLARFNATRDEDAFTAPVRRHSSLVLGTARRIVHDASDADDVFQATFLTLSRKANSLRCKESLAAWLHRVTFRLALRARKRSRPVTGTPRLTFPGNDPLEKISARELCSAIDEELERLSTGLRATIVLCCLQGMTRDEASAELGWSTATLNRRLARARAILGRRLTARGITLTTALAPAVLSASLPPSACAGAIGTTIEMVLVGLRFRPRLVCSALPQPAC